MARSWKTLFECHGKFVLSSLFSNSGVISSVSALLGELSDQGHYPWLIFPRALASCNPGAEYLRGNPSVVNLPSAPRCLVLFAPWLFWNSIMLHRKRCSLWATFPSTALSEETLQKGARFLIHYSPFKLYNSKEKAGKRDCKTEQSSTKSHAVKKGFAFS